MAAELKRKGTEAFQNKEYEEAIKFYGQAIALSASDHLLYSNRSAAFAGAGKYEEALVDAQKCVELKPDFAKGYGRLGLAQFHLNKLMDAKKAYEEGLKHDSQSPVLKDGLKDTKRNFRPWFLSILAEATTAQRGLQKKLCEATHQLVSGGETSLSFAEAHQKILELSLPEDTLDKYGISEEDFQQTIEEYEKAYDYEVVTMIQQMYSPADQGDPQKASTLEIGTLVEVHKFMESQMKDIVESFLELPAEKQQSMPKKEREYTAELLVSVSVESSFKIQSEDLELAVMMQGEKLSEDVSFVECQKELGSLLQRLREPPFNDMERASGQTLSRTSASSCNVGIITALGLVVLLGFISFRARRK